MELGMELFADRQPQSAAVMPRRIRVQTGQRNRVRTRFSTVPLQEHFDGDGLSGSRAALTYLFRQRARGGSASTVNQTAEVGVSPLALPAS